MATKSELKGFARKIKMEMLNMARAYNRYLTWDYFKNLTPRGALAFVHPYDRRLFASQVDYYELKLIELNKRNHGTSTFC